MRDTGAYLQKWLEDVAFKSGEQIESIRGKGTYLAFDVTPMNKKLDVHKALREKGVNTGTAFFVWERSQKIFSKTWRKDDWNKTAFDFNQKGGRQILGHPSAGSSLTAFLY